MIRALAQLPLPRRPSVHYHGCFAPNSGARSQAVPAGDMPKRRRKQAEGKPLKTVEQPSTRLSCAACLKRSFLYAILDCPCGGRRRMVAAVQHKGEIERFLRHVRLWPETLDIMAIRGPPEVFESSQDEPEPWDQHDETPAEDWAG
jgi:hypothetical protein